MTTYCLVDHYSHGTGCGEDFGSGCSVGGFSWGNGVGCGCGNREGYEDIPSPCDEMGTGYGGRIRGNGVSSEHLP